jgi:TonB family protein
VKSVIVAGVVGFALALAPPPGPARYQTGSLPPLAPMAVGGGQVFLEVSIDRGGHVAAVTPLRTTPPFTELMIDAVRDWMFQPADEDGPIESTVFVAAVYRAPAFEAPTLGELPKDIAAPSSGAPFPIVTIAPRYPPRARTGGVVLVETTVDREGSVSDVRVVRSAPPFDAAAAAAARQWRFRAALLRGTPVGSIVYIVFGFPAPVTLPRFRASTGWTQTSCLSGRPCAPAPSKGFAAVVDDRPDPADDPATGADG